MRKLPHCHHGPTSSFLHSPPIQSPPNGPGFICAAGQMLIWDVISQSRHSVDRSPRAFHFSTHNVVRASCFEVVSASVGSIKLFMGRSLCLAGRWSWSVYLGSSSGRQRSALLATLRRMWGEAIPRSAYKQGIEPAFKQPVIILRESFRAISTCPVYVWYGPTKNIKFSCRKPKRQCGCSYGSCGSCRLLHHFLKLSARVF